MNCNKTNWPICNGMKQHVNRGGVAAVEFAVVVPFFVLIVFGMIEVGRGIMVQQILTNAAREGARQAILDGATISDVKTVVGAQLENLTIAGANVSVSPDPANAKSRQAITVNVSVPIANVTWVARTRFFDHSGHFTAQATMLKEAD